MVPEDAGDDAPASAIERQCIELSQRVAHLEAELAARDAELVARDAELEHARALLETAQSDIERGWALSIEVLAGQVARRQGYGLAEVKHRAALSHAMGTLLGLVEQDLQFLHRAAMLQGIGKVGLPDELLAQPRSTLSVEDTERFLGHAVAGAAVLLAIPHLAPAASAVRHQNERWDGTGAPDRLLREHIPVGARILAVAGDYHALVRGALLEGRQAPRDAMRWIREQGGTAYDPRIVDAFEVALPTLVNLPGGDELRVEVSQLAPGMVLARDLVSAGDLLLLRRGQQIDAALAERLADLEKLTGQTLEVRVTVDSLSRSI